MDKKINLRLDQETYDLLQELIESYEKQGIELSQSAVVRMAIKFLAESK